MWEKRNDFSLDSKTSTESLLRTVFGSEFETADAQHREKRFANAVVVKGWHSVVVLCGTYSDFLKRRCALTSAGGGRRPRLTTCDMISPSSYTWSVTGTPSALDTQQLSYNLQWSESWCVGSVICLQQGADCSHMVWPMPLPSSKSHNLSTH